MTEPQHNEADLGAWISSIEHIRATPGYPDGNWPPPEGMTLEANLADLRRHAADFAAGKGFTFTVLDPTDSDVIGCVYLYPAPSEDHDVTVRSWVRASHAELDVPLADALVDWIDAEWPWSGWTAAVAERSLSCGRSYAGLRRRSEAGGSSTSGSRFVQLCCPGHRRPATVEAAAKASTAVASVKIHSSLTSMSA